MKKKISIHFLFLLLLFTTACAGPTELFSGVKVKSELNSYIEEIGQLNEVQNTLLAEYEQGFVEETDNEVALNHLNEEIIPPFETFLQDTRSVQLETEEVKNLHAIYIEAMEIQLEVFTDFKQSLETDNDALFDEANNKVDQVNELLDQHENQFKDLTKEYNINLEFAGE
ncbi:hypothetical protein IMZ08_18160 [Bacillus luteolus]|uniref:Lipoprotein n=1 Tax=Litchfieldia luteola TaxID=682179 RepID=A0ABR9QN78_9BACI|nr:hypothetical protein [Cytobacillus luteolus]MBE4909964.1 hypothetical protein [Cytobacillus luteolus]MBP1942479.1 hypothetical protein [Cytobacillus luteolus]